MTSSPIKKPFYFQPPWNVFFEVHKFRRIRPWNINISFLLLSFLDEMNKRGKIDFRASGVALDSSATIFLMKSKLLLKLEEPPPQPKHSPDFLPPPLFLPLRYELMSTTFQHLLTVLNEVLKSEHLFSLKPSPSIKPPPPPPEVFPPIDLYLMEIEKQMKSLYRFLLQLASEEKLVVFSKVAAGLEKIEAVKAFITLLFLAQRGKVSLWQEEDFGEICIILREAPVIGEGETVVT